MRGEYKRGDISITKNQQKKHYTQMTNGEKEYIINKLNQYSISNICLSNHVIENKNREFSMSDIYSILKKDELIDLIIEYNTNGKDRRILIRDNSIHTVDFLDSKGNFICKENANLCFVISINSGRIITVYWNIHGDNHDTIDWRRYDAQLKIII